MKRIALIGVPLLLLGLAGIALVLMLRRRASATPGLEPAAPSHGSAAVAGVDVLSDHEMHREEDEEFRHGALQHIGEERLSIRPL